MVFTSLLTYEVLNLITLLRMWEMMRLVHDMMSDSVEK